jgi:hypothetical protein
MRHIRENGRRRGARLGLTLALATGIVTASATAAEAGTYVFHGSIQLAQKATVRSISCITGDNCVVVGDEMARTFNGHTETPIPDLDGPAKVVDGRDRNSWNSVSCVPSGACMITGLGDDGDAAGSAFRASLTAAWSRPVMPIPAQIKANPGNYFFQSLSCASATFCVEVATIGTETGTESAEWRWDGTSWHVGNLNPAGVLIHLRGVSCWAANECLVVGDDQYATPIHWRLDGSTWHRANLPHPPGGSFSSVIPEAVSCWSTEECTIIGTRTAKNTPDSIIVWQWSGGSFTDTNVKSPPSGDTTFLSLSCLSAAFCVAAGDHGDNSVTGTLGTYVVLWDGAAWTRLSVHVTNVGAGRKSVAQAVSCTDAYFCRLVGYDYTNNGVPPMTASSFLDSLRPT